MPNYGTLTLFDNPVQNTNVNAFGENRAADILAEDLAAYNESINASLAELTQPTVLTQESYGVSAQSDMIEVDEYGVADAQRTNINATVGFPLRQYSYTLQWTRLWMLTHTIRDLELQYIAARTADYTNILRQAKRALFVPTNTPAYIDRYQTGTTYALRALVNADSQPIPRGPNGEAFNGATHTHYLASASLTAAAAKSLIDTVAEHGHGGAMRVYINRTNESAWRALAGFATYVDSRIVSGVGQGRNTLDVTRLDNRAIGVFEGAEIWSKPWVPANYAFAFDLASPKPLGMRTRDNAALAQLQIAAENEAYPLRAQFMQREFGLSAWTRTNGAVLFSAGGVYVAPVV